MYCPQGSATLCQQLLTMQGIVWYCMVLHGIVWYCIVLHGIASLLLGAIVLIGMKYEL